MNADTATCQACGTPISAEVLGGKCPTCLKKVALMEPTLSDDTAIVDPPSKNAKEPVPMGTFGNFDDYEIIAPIAHGGMGVVYRARQRRLKREVALKMVLNGSYANAEELRRFRVEAEAVARLDHPNIVPLFEAGEQDGRPWFSMRLLEGGTLATKLSDAPGGKLEPRAAAALVAKIARAMHHAHQRGLLHRDLKPANILLDEEGEPHVSDFGLAKPVEDAGHTVTGAVLGTPGYMAPEQAAGKVNELTTATDVFALGAILYHLLVGRPPFEGNSSLEILSKVIQCEPARPASTRARIDRDLETICMRCLEKQPGLRFSSADALADDLDRWSQGEPILSRKSNAWERTVKWARRRPAIAALAVLLGLSLIFGMSGIFWQWRRAEDALGHSRESLWKANYERARSVRISGRMGQRTGALIAIRDAAAIRSERVLRDEALAALALPDFEDLGKPIDLPIDVSIVAMDSNSSKWVAATATGALVTGDMRGSPVRTLLAGTTLIGQRRIISNIIVSKSGRLILWDGGADKGAAHGRGVLDATGVEKPLFLYPWRPAAVAHDDKSFVVTNEDGRIESRAWPSGEVIASGKTAPPLIADADISADGTEVAIMGLASVEVFRNNAGQLQRTAFRPYSRTSSAPSSPKWHPETRVVAVAAEASVSLWSVDDDRLSRLGVHDQANVRLWFHPSGQWLLSLARDGVSILWNVASGKPLLKAEIGQPLGFSADGSELWVLRDTKITRLRFHGWPACRILSTPWPGSESIDQPKYHTSGRMLAASDGLWLRVWADGAPRSVAGFVTPAGTTRFPMQFLKDGRLMTVGPPSATWEVSVDQDHIRIGSPVVVPHPGKGFVLGMAQSPDGREFTLPYADGVQSMATEDSQIIRKLKTPRHFGTLNYSPDGKWLAGGPNYSGGAPKSAVDSPSEVFIWEMPGGRLTQRLMARGCDLAFSPDSRWLIIGDSRSIRQYSTTDWQMAYEYAQTSDGPEPPRIAFSPDGRLLAMHQDGRRIRLVEPDSHEVLANLTPPFSTRLRKLSFSPDSTELAVGADGGLFLWDLSALRSSLREMGLDWAADEPLKERSRPWSLSSTARVRVSLAHQPIPSLPLSYYQAISPEKGAEALKYMQQYPPAEK